MKRESFFWLNRVRTVLNRSHLTLGRSKRESTLKVPSTNGKLYLHKTFWSSKSIPLVPTYLPTYVRAKAKTFRREWRSNFSFKFSLSFYLFSFLSILSLSFLYLTFVLLLSSCLLSSSYKASTIVNYNSRCILTSKLLIFMTQET